MYHIQAMDSTMEFMAFHNVQGGYGRTAQYFRQDCAFTDSTAQSTEQRLEK